MATNFHKSVKAPFVSYLMNVGMILEYYSNSFGNVPKSLSEVIHKNDDEIISRSTWGQDTLVVYVTHYPDLF